MSLILDILDDLWNTHLYYKGVRVNFFGIPKPFKQKENSYRSTISRLNKKGFITKTQKGWVVTNTGKKYLLKNKKKKELLIFKPNLKINSPKNLIVMFDIPEVRKIERQWLRTHLKKFDYFMIQKSVWVGPSPLPPKFVSYLKEITLDPYLKQFKLAKPYKIRKTA